MLSGPLLDRIDLQVFVPRLEPAALTAAAAPAAETSALVRQRVVAARARQLARAGRPNAQLTPRELERDASLEAASRQLLQTAMARLGLSARTFHRIINVARTIADLAEADTLAAAHVAEAIRLRQIDRECTA
jgi:magnesium chelatase family protein